MEQSQLDLLATLVARANGGSLHASPTPGSLVAIPQTEQLAHQLWALSQALQQPRVSPAATTGGAASDVARPGTVYEPSINDDLGILCATAFGDYLRAKASTASGDLNPAEAARWLRAASLELARFNQLESAWVGDYQAIALPSVDALRQKLEGADGTPRQQDEGVGGSLLAGIDAVDAVALLDAKLESRVGLTAAQVRETLGGASASLGAISKEEWLEDLDAGSVPPPEFGGLGLPLMGWVKKMPPRTPPGEAQERQANEPRAAYIRRATPHIELFDAARVKRERSLDEAEKSERHGEPHGSPADPSDD